MTDEARCAAIATCAKLAALLRKIREGAVIARDDLRLDHESSAAVVLCVMATRLRQIAQACDDLARTVSN